MDGAMGHIWQAVCRIAKDGWRVAHKQCHIIEVYCKKNPFIYGLVGDDNLVCMGLAIHAALVHDTTLLFLFTQLDGVATLLIGDALLYGMAGHVFLSNSKLAMNL